MGSMITPSWYLFIMPLRIMLASVLSVGTSFDGVNDSPSKPFGRTVMATLHQ